MVIDEAAAIPLPLVKELLGPYLCSCPRPSMGKSQIGGGSGGGSGCGGIGGD